MPDESQTMTLVHFLNDIVLKFSLHGAPQTMHSYRWSFHGSQESVSVLRDVSDRAIEAYFSVFHILLCVICERPDRITKIDTAISDFLAGKVRKIPYCIR